MVQLLADQARTGWQQAGDITNFLKDLFTLVAILPASIWAIYVFVDSRRKEASTRLLNLFGSFYLKPELHRLRLSIDYDYDTKLRPVIEKLLINPQANFDEAEKNLLLDLDTASNLLEFALHLKKREHLSEEDVDAVFGYWYRLLRRPERAAMRVYLRCYDYGAITALLDEEMNRGLVLKEDQHLVAFYGTLMRDGQGQRLAGIGRDELKDHGDCVLPGTLYDIGEYPGLILKPGSTDGGVRGELYRAANSAVLAKLDDYEGFEPGNRGSLFERRCVLLTSPPFDCWIYVYNRDLGDKPEIKSGDWSSHRPGR